MGRKKVAGNGPTRARQYRLDAETISRMDWLSDHFAGVGHADVIRIAVKRLHDAEKRRGKSEKGT